MIQFYTLLSGDGWGRTGSKFRPRKLPRICDQPQWDLGTPSDEDLNSIAWLDENLCLGCGRPCDQSALQERGGCAYCGSKQSLHTDPSLLRRAMAAIRSEVTCVKKMVKQEQCELDYVIDASPDEALRALRAMVAADAAAEARERAKIGGAGHSIWELRGVHLGSGVCVQKTLDDFLMAFVMWGREGSARETAVGGRGAGGEGAGGGREWNGSAPECTARYNISKALRRLQNFAMFQEQCYEQYLQEPVTVEEVGRYVSIENHPLKALVGCPVARGPQGHRIMEISYAPADVSAAAAGRECLEPPCASFRSFFGLVLLMCFDDVAVTDGLIWREHLGSLSMAQILEIVACSGGTEKYQEWNYLLWCCAPFRVQHFDMSVGPSLYVDCLERLFRGYIDEVIGAGATISSSVTGGASLKSELDPVAF